MTNRLPQTVVLLVCLALSAQTRAQITDFAGSHDLFGEVTHSLLTSIPPFSFTNEYNQETLVSSFGSNTTGYDLLDPVFIESQIAMTSHWNATESSVTGYLSKSGQSKYEGQQGNSLNPYYDSDSTAEFVLQLEEVNTPYKITVTWNLGPVILSGDASGYSTFHVVAGNAILTTQLGSIAGGTLNNVGLGSNLGPNGTYVFEGTTVTDSLALKVRLFGPGLTRGANGCFDMPCGIGLVSDTSFVSYEILVGDDALPLDTDSDQIPDTADNCTQVANADQYDSNGDGFGNLCDPDLDNNGVVNFSDYVLVANRFLDTSDSPTWLADADFNNDGAINFADIAIISSYFLLPPGPSGMAP